MCSSLRSGDTRGAAWRSRRVRSSPGVVQRGQRRRTGLAPPPPRHRRCPTRRPQSETDHVEAAPGVGLRQPAQLRSFQRWLAQGPGELVFGTTPWCSSTVGRDAMRLASDSKAKGGAPVPGLRPRGRLQRRGYGMPAVAELGSTPDLSSGRARPPGRRAGGAGPAGSRAGRGIDECGDRNPGTHVLPSQQVKQRTAAGQHHGLGGTTSALLRRICAAPAVRTPGKVQPGIGNGRSMAPEHRMMWLAFSAGTAHRGGNACRGRG